MKVAVIGEAVEDEAFARVLVQSVLASAVDSDAVRVRPNGWSSLSYLVPKAIQQAHYLGLDGLVVLADSDDSPVREDDARDAEVFARKGRLRLLLRLVEDTQVRLKARAGAPPVRVACGLAVPSLEAWCLSLDDGAITESATRTAVREGRRAFDRDELKLRLYGSTRSSPDHKCAVVEECARRIAADLERMTRLFPIGFGSLHRDLRRWRD